MQQQIVYQTPSGKYFDAFRQMADGNHLLIGGATGCGKSTLLHGIIHTLLYSGPWAAQFILIDPKMVELSEYQSVPHCVRYANDHRSIVDALCHTVRIMEARLSTMNQRREKSWTGPHLYVVIDELADLMTVSATRKACLPLLQRILQTGRAAGISVLAATQTTVATVIPTTLKCNFADRVALRTATAQDSRNIIAQAGAECFPDPIRTGKALCYWRHGANLDLYRIPTYSAAEHERILTHWTNPRLCRVA